MKNKQFLLQVVLACSITILAVSAIATATTIGTNISTDGTLSAGGNFSLFDSTTASTSVFMSDSYDLLGVGAAGQGWRINDEAENMMIGATYIPAANYSALWIKTPSSGSTGFVITDNDDETPFELSTEENDKLNMKFQLTDLIPEANLEFKDTEQDYWTFSFDEATNMFRSSGGADEGAIPGLVIGSTDAVSNYSLSGNDVIIAQDLEVQANTYLGTTGIATGTPTTDLDVNGLMRAAKTSTTTCSVTYEGAIFYNPNNSRFWGCDGSDWVRLDSN